MVVSGGMLVALVFAVVCSRVYSRVWIGKVFGQTIWIMPPADRLLSPSVSLVNVLNKK